MLTTLAVLVSLTFPQDPAEAIYESVTPSVLTLSATRTDGAVATGTAFLAIRDGLAVTAWHVVKGATKVIAKFSDGAVVAIKGLIDKNEALDLAIIELESHNRKALPVADGDPKVGSRAYVIGSPKGMAFSISDGIISQTPMMEGEELYQFTCPVSPGNSGGPLLNSKGQVLGVVSWQLRDAQNLNFAVPARSIQRLDAAKPLIAFSATEAPTNESNKLNDTVLRGCFEKLGLKSSSEDDGTGKTAFQFDSGGSKASLFQYAKNGQSNQTVSLSLSAAFKVQDANLQRLNDFNRSNRFVRCYLDKNGTVYLEDDKDLTTTDNENSLCRFVSVFCKSMDRFVGHLSGKAESLDDESEPGEDSTLSAYDVEKGLVELGWSAKKQDSADGRCEWSV
ncbi:MAG: trypsin-like peptidase domain-containing protein, partial [Chthonomonadaceae bacterium]|nr:trypsin-like peptidase domain-containing protein [Chthonomonadaceae bacterium]